MQIPTTFAGVLKLKNEKDEIKIRFSKVIPNTAIRKQVLRQCPAMATSLHLSEIERTSSGGRQYDFNYLNNLVIAADYAISPLSLEELTFARVDSSLLRAPEMSKIFLPSVKKLYLHQCDITAVFLRILQGPNGLTNLTSLKYVSWCQEICPGADNLEELRAETTHDAWMKLPWPEILKLLPRLRLLELRLLELRFGGNDASVLARNGVSVADMTKLCPLIEIFGQQLNAVSDAVQRGCFTKRFTKDIEDFAVKARGWDNLKDIKISFTPSKMTGKQRYGGYDKELPIF
jgi:hypothetical protein